MDPKQKLPGLYDPRFGMTTAVLAQLPTSKVSKHIKQLTRHSTLQKTQSTEQVRMQKERPVMVWGSCSRSPIVSSRKQLPRLVLPWEMRESTVLVCSFFPQDELARKQAMKMFEIIVKKEGLTFLAGERFQLRRKYQAKRQQTLCLISPRALWQNRTM